MQLETTLPEEIEAKYKRGTLTVDKEGTEVQKQLKHPQVDVKVQENRVVFKTHTDKKDVKSVAKTFQTHLENMVEGLQNPHTYKLKAVYAHFPMTIKTQGNELIVENFMGERHPRKAKIGKNVDVTVDEEEITVQSPDKEAASQTAARIEQLSKKGNRDPRTFQDGIYIVEGETQ